jgi:hypothetical protein
MGVIGMWTSAEHELSDPLGASVHIHAPHTHLTHNSLGFLLLLFFLGPFWAWKVGPPSHLCPTLGLGGRLRQQQGPSWIGGTASSSSSSGASASGSGRGPGHAAAEWDSDEI